MKNNIICSVTEKFVMEHYFDVVVAAAPLTSREMEREFSISLVVEGEKEEIRLVCRTFPYGASAPMGIEVIIGGAQVAAACISNRLQAGQ